MDELATQIADKVVKDVSFYTAVIGLLGVVIGAVITALGNLLLHFLQERSRAKTDVPRKALLLKMLEDNRFPQKWRRLDTLKHVIGADEETTKKLLLEINARASEDGQQLWGLLKDHPLDTTAR